MTAVHSMKMVSNGDPSPSMFQTQSKKSPDCCVWVGPKRNSLHAQFILQLFGLLCQSAAETTVSCADVAAVGATNA